MLACALMLGSAYLFSQATQAELLPYIGTFPLNALLGTIGFTLAVVFGALSSVLFLRLRRERGDAERQLREKTEEMAADRSVLSRG